MRTGTTTGIIAALCTAGGIIIGTAVEGFLQADRESVRELYRLRLNTFETYANGLASTAAKQYKHLPQFNKEAIKAELLIGLAAPRAVVEARRKLRVENMKYYRNSDLADQYDPTGQLRLGNTTCPKSTVREAELLIAMRKVLVPGPDSDISVNDMLASVWGCEQPKNTKGLELEEAGDAKKDPQRATIP